MKPPVQDNTGNAKEPTMRERMKMHNAMDIAYTGNADVDFVKGMIPHHAGAVDMAKTVLVFKDGMIEGEKLRAEQKAQEQRVQEERPRSTAARSLLEDLHHAHDGAPAG